MVSSSEGRRHGRWLGWGGDDSDVYNYISRGRWNAEDEASFSVLKFEASTARRDAPGLERV